MALSSGPTLDFYPIYKQEEENEGGGSGEGKMETTILEQQ